MDENTPVLILIAVAAMFTYSIVGSQLIESGTGRRMPLLERIGLPQSPRVPLWLAAPWLIVIFGLTGILQIVMVSAAIGPDRAPITRAVGVLGTAMFVGWVIKTVRLLRMPIR